MHIAEEFYSKIQETIIQGRSYVYRSINFALLVTYWEVGKLIAEEEHKNAEKQKYGTYLIKELSDKLSKEFGKGYDLTNLKYCRQFYQTFKTGHTVSDLSENNKGKISHTVCDRLQKTDEHSFIADFEKHPILKILRTELSWSHYRLLLKLENKEAREYYINEAVKSNWSVRALERQINSLYYERLLSSRNKKAVIKEAEAKTKELKSNPEDFIKNPFVIEFTGLKQDSRYLEKELEQGLIDNLQLFLLELGRGFSFVSRQQRITADNENFYIDLVFYNYLLKCFILIDLKTDKLTHQDIGQMDFYVRYWEDNLKGKDDNPTIGIILCTEKNEIIAKYSVLSENKRLFASKYKLYLPTEEKLKRELAREYDLLTRK